MIKINLGIIIQARTGSSRLPNKILRKFYDEKSILDIIVERLRDRFSSYPIILATSTCVNDNDLFYVSQQQNILFYQGSENNVLLRFVEVVNQYNFTHVIRICSDNPFLNMVGIKGLIDKIDDINIDYLSYCDSSGTPVIKTHLGLFAEVVSVRALILANKLQNNPIYQEHVTNFIYENSDLFNVKLFPCFEEVIGRKDIRFTVDDIDDFENLSFLYNQTEYRVNEDLKKLVKHIDQNIEIRNKMVKNIKKYIK